MHHLPLSSNRPVPSRSHHVLFILLVAGMCILPMSCPVFAAPADLLANTAKGTFTPEGKPAVTLVAAAAFVDVKDSDKPTILILSDKKLATEKWTSEFDLMRAHPVFSGAIFWLNAEGSVYRSDIYVAGEQSSVSGFFTLTLNGVMGKDLTGTVTKKDDDKGPKVEATFHAVVP